MPELPPVTTPTAGYTDTTSLAAYLGIDVSALPADVARLILRASEAIDYWTHNRCIADTTLVTTYATALEAAANAVIETWIAGTEPVLASGTVEEYTTDEIRVKYAPGGSTTSPGAIPHRAYQALLPTGLLYAGVATL